MSITRLSGECRDSKHFTCPHHGTSYCSCPCHTRSTVRNFEDELHYQGTQADSDLVFPSDPPRPGRARTLLDVAHVIAKRGTCSRAKVGCVVARDGRIISTGYNGAPSGVPHCQHYTWQPFTNDNPPHWVINSMGENDFYDPAEGDIWYNDNGEVILTRSNTKLKAYSSCTVSEHAERNAIAYAARYGLSTDQSELYSTHAPCVDCARAIINSGIIRVFYEIPYRLSEGLTLLRKVGVEVVHLSA